jgi:hypothetical protein
MTDTLTRLLSENGYCEPTALKAAAGEIDALKARLDSPVKHDVLDISEWIHQIISGIGGLHDYEKYELAVPRIDRDEAAASWAIRCLANPKSETAGWVLDAIIERREKLKGGE